MLILIAMGLASEVSYVVALRQASIPIGVLLSLLVLKEALPLPRIQGVVGDYFRADTGLFISAVLLQSIIFVYGSNGLLEAVIKLTCKCNIADI